MFLTDMCGAKKKTRKHTISTNDNRKKKSKSKEKVFNQKLNTEQLKHEIHFDFRAISSWTTKRLGEK